MTSQTCSDDRHRFSRSGRYRALRQSVRAGRHLWAMNTLPPDWTMARPDEITASEPHALAIGPFGSNLKVSDYRDEGVPLVFVRNIRSGCFSGPETRFVSRAKADELHAHRVACGDLLITKMGDPPGDVAVFPLDEGIITADCIKIRPDPALDVDYLRYALESPQVQRQIRDITSGAAQTKVSLERFRTRVTIPIAPPSEQRRIARILDLTSDVVRQARASDMQLAIAMQVTFRRFFGVPPLAGAWPVQTLGGVALIFSDGPFGSNLKSSDYVPTGVRVVRLQNIGVGQFLGADSAFIGGDHFTRLSKHECLPDDVMIATLGDPNIRACVLPQDVTRAINKADCVQMRIDPSLVTNEYIVSLLNDPRFVAHAMRESTGQTRTRISMGRLRQVEITIPPLELQRRHAEVFRELEAMRHAQARRVALAGELTRSLANRAFLGRL
jgi:type I restriction enzyme S subunit